MNDLNFKFISCAVVFIFAILCCIRANETAKNSEDIQENSTSVKPKLIRHVHVTKNIPQSPSPFTTNLEPSITGKPGEDDSSNSEEIYFSPKNHFIQESQSAPASSTTQSEAVLRDLSSHRPEYDEKTNSSILQSFDGGVINTNESSSRSKVVRAVANTKEAVVINADKDRAKLEERESTGSNLWIYLNAVCILLVVGVSIFLIYYPKIRGDRRTVCHNPSQSTSVSSAASVPT